MADWEDDDFGGFESADLGSVSETQVPSPSHSTALAPSTSPASGNTGTMQVLDWILSNTPKSDASVAATTLPVSSGTSIPFAIDSGKGFELTAGNEPGSQTTDEERTGPGGSLQSEVIGVDTTKSDNVSAETIGMQDESKEGSPQYMESKDAIQALAAEEAKIEIHRQEKALQDLQAKLDAALAVKEQTEKSLGKLQDELKSCVEQGKKELEEKEKKHAELIEVAKEQHMKEIKALQKTSEDTVETISKQYAEVWKLFQTQKENEEESNANLVVSKCCDILTQQQAVLTQKLEDNRLCQEQEIQKTLSEEKEKMESELKIRLQEEKEKFQTEMNNHFKEELAKEINRLEEVHTATLREAMLNQEKHFEDLLKCTLENERDKFAERLKDVVVKTQLDAEEALLQRRKLEEIRTRNHRMSIKMFLTSAMKQLECDLSDGTKDDASDHRLQKNATS